MTVYYHDNTAIFSFLFAVLSVWQYLLIIFSICQVPTLYVLFTRHISCIEWVIKLYSLTYCLNWCETLELCTVCRMKRCWRGEHQPAWQWNVTQGSQDQLVFPSMTVLSKLMPWRTGRQGWQKEDASKTIFLVSFWVQSLRWHLLEIVYTSWMYHKTIITMNVHPT